MLYSFKLKLNSFFSFNTQKKSNYSRLENPDENQGGFFNQENVPSLANLPNTAIKAKPVKQVDFNSKNNYISKIIGTLYLSITYYHALNGSQINQLIQKHHLKLGKFAQEFFNHYYLPFLSKGLVIKNNVYFNRYTQDELYKDIISRGSDPTYLSTKELEKYSNKIVNKITVKIIERIQGAEKLSDISLDRISNTDCLLISEVLYNIKKLIKISPDIHPKVKMHVINLIESSNVHSSLIKIYPFLNNYGAKNFI